MKILSIKGKNLASIEGEFSIDFRVEPLRSAGIFAITGNTGSGKTTLLDAMCIALFYKSPRTHKAKTDKSSEREEDSVKENDCRNILRHGTSDCYAEVEFLALNGKEYRSRWSVNRARNKADGNIQAAKYELFCISDNLFISKSKKETEETIVRLIGLNYEQFTRAVLLAQGEFSAFLKASPNEKADILEKLTGTGIYARISERIYEKSKDAETTLNIIGEKLNGITILSPEEFTQLQEEKERLQKAAENGKEMLFIINEKIKWIERSVQLELEKTNAIKQVEQYKAKLEALTDTVKTLELTELVQPIREIYSESKRTRNRIEEEELQLKSLNELLQRKKEEFDASEKLLNECKSNKEKIEKQKAEAEPLIIEATRVESERNNCKARLLESESLVAETKKQHTQCTEKQSINKRTIASIKEEQVQIKAWFEANSIYNDVITRCEIIFTAIADSKDAQAQIEHKSNMLKKSQEQQVLFEKHLSLAKEETEKLKATMTLEIATLRKQLTEGTPCPVCGSCHHPTIHITENILNEKELERARKENETNINRLNENIERIKNETVTLAASIEEYKKIYTSRLNTLLSLLGKLPQSKLIESYDNPIAVIEKIATEIAEIANEWNRKNSRTAQLEQALALEQNNLANSETRIKELWASISTNEEIISRLRSETEEYDKQLAQILGNARSVGEITEYFRKEIDKSGKDFSRCTLLRNDSLVALTKTEQAIENLQHSIEDGKKKANDFSVQIDEFIYGHRDSITHTQLEEVMLISAEESLQMRRRITTAKENLLQAETQLNERLRNIDQHKQSTTKPGEEENKEQLSIMLQQIKEQTAQNMESITQISVKLNSDKENKLRTEKLRNEYDDAKQYSTDWKRLCEVFGAAKGQKFRMIAQGYTLDIMLSYANMHLKQLSSRYQLVRTAPDSLALMIIDLDMLSERRTVNTLSGGETFLVSLALALALSSLSSNNMSIESLFIDEGFGSLDSDTLRVAMEALEHLQSQGRKIGVISHLSNMIERIPTQICVHKKRGGKSIVEIRQQY